MTGFGGWVGLLTALSLAACSSTPVTVERVSLRAAYDQSNRTALSSDQLSDTTRSILRRAGLIEAFEADPTTAIALQRGRAIAAGMDWPDLYALAEMSYFEGRRGKSKPVLLASALYAYAVLFPAGGAQKPSPFSVQFSPCCGLLQPGTQVL